MVSFIEKLSREEEGIMLAERALTKVSRDYEKWARALFREKAAMDYRSGINTARKEGHREGREEGREEARQEYEAEKFKIARKLKAKGLPLAEIVEVTGIPPEDLANL